MPNWMMELLEFYKEKPFYRLSLTILFFYSGLAVLEETLEPEEIDAMFNTILGLFLTFLFFYGLTQMSRFYPQSYHSKVWEASQNKTDNALTLWQTAYYTTLSEIDQMSGLEFEEFLVQFFQERGYHVTTTSMNGDFGADLILESNQGKIAVQAKCYVNAVGIEAVYQAISGMNYYSCNSAMVITNSRFTPRAVELADRARVEMWDRNRLEKELNELY